MNPLDAAEKANSIIAAGGVTGALLVCGAVMIVGLSGAVVCLWRTLGSERDKRSAERDAAYERAVGLIDRYHELAHNLKDSLSHLLERNNDNGKPANAS